MQTPGDNGGQGNLVCCSPWGLRIGHNLATEQQQQQNLVSFSSDHFCQETTNAKIFINT